MECLHPHCPMNSQETRWEMVVEDPRLKVRDRDKAELITNLNQISPLLGTSHTLQIGNEALKNRLLELCPCLYTQLEEKVSAEGVVHLCEITLESRIKSNNVHTAFSIQHPNENEYSFRYAPLVEGAGVGGIAEGLCSEVLDNEGIPHSELDSDGWPIWKSPCHISFNKGKMTALKSYGDILIPSAPTNILISVKTQAARERLLVSGNRFESIGFGFFNEPHEFWATSKISLFKRMGFTAIYMLETTLNEINNHLEVSGQNNYAININGTNLYRSLSEFGHDMRRVAGKTTLAL